MCFFLYFIDILFRPLSSKHIRLFSIYTAFYNSFYITYLNYSSKRFIHIVHFCIMVVVFKLHLMLSVCDNKSRNEMLKVFLLTF